MKDCFVIMPIGSGDAYKVYKNRYDYIIKPAIEGLMIDGVQALRSVRADLISESGSITKTVIQLLYSAFAVIADLTDLNPNVFYELGVRHALRNKTILVALESTKPPFDVGDLRIVWYQDRVGGERDAIPKIQELLCSLLKDGIEPTDSPVLAAVPGLLERRDITELEAKFYALQKDNDELRTKLRVAEEVNLSLQQTASSVTEAVEKALSKYGAQEKKLTEEEIQKAVAERHQILARPQVFSVPEYQVNSKCVFVLIPFAEEFMPVYALIKEAAQEAGLSAFRVDELVFAASIMDQIFEQILRAGLIVADVTGRNPNVLYEMGIAMTIGKPMLLLSQSIDDVPFDLRHMRVLVYGTSLIDAPKLKESLRKSLLSYIESQAHLAEASDTHNKGTAPDANRALRGRRR